METERVTGCGGIPVFNPIGICQERRGIIAETASNSGCRVKRENRNGD